MNLQFEEIIKKAEEAIQEVFGSTMVSISDVQDALSDLAGSIEIMLEGLDLDE